MSRPDFPRSLPEFARRFPDERACFDYLIQSRWPDRFVCPNCGHDRWYEREERLVVECAKCRKLLSATAGTAMHGSRQPLSFWLLAAWLMVTDKRGVSAVQLQRQLGIKRHEVAYQMLHRLRAAMVAPEREALRGTVEVDETYVGGRDIGSGKHGRGTSKHLVMGAVEVVDGAPVRIRLRAIDSATGANLLGFIKDNVEAGSTIVTDAYLAYRSVTKVGYKHEVETTVHGTHPDDVLPRLHLVFSNLKAWIHGTFHGAIRQEHLQAYLNEFVFRFNRREHLHAAFQTLLGLAPKSEGPTLSGLYKGTFTHKNPAGRKRA